MKTDTITCTCCTCAWVNKHYWFFTKLCSVSVLYTILHFLVDFSVFISKIRGLSLTCHRDNLYHSDNFDGRRVRLLCWNPQAMEWLKLRGKWEMSCIFYLWAGKEGTALTGSLFLVGEWAKRAKHSQVQKMGKSLYIYICVLPENFVCQLGIGSNVHKAWKYER